MINFGIPNLIRFLIGIVLLQGVTGLLVYIALTTNWQTTWPLFLILGLSIGFLVALWFSTIVGAERKHVVSRASERFSKEREQIRVKAEQQRIKDVRSIAKAARGGLGAGMSLKSGVVVGGAVGLGVAMMLTQFMALGLLTLATAGGAALGYGVRVRQEKMIANRRLSEQEKALNIIEAPQVTAAIANRSRRKLRAPRDSDADAAG
jgi:hypothetical protein